MERLPHYRKNILKETTEVDPWTIQVWPAWVHFHVCEVASVVSDPLWSHGLEAPRLLCLWDSPSKNIGVGCHLLLQGIRMGHPKTCQNDVLIGMNWSCFWRSWCKKETLSFSVSMKAGNESLLWKVHSLHLEIEGPAYHQRRRIWSLETCINNTLYLFNLLSQAQTI